MHLLFTDPSTSPRTELGRIVFGMLYGLGNIALYELLGQADMPRFYDKLLPVPILNLSIKAIDQLARSRWMTRIDPARLGHGLTGRRRHLAYMSLWAVVFAGMSRLDAVGDNHEGHTVPFWQNACVQNARGACDNLAVILDTYCADGSGWACNEVGVLRWHGRTTGSTRVLENFEAACQRGFGLACQNALRFAVGEPPSQAPPRLADYPVVLRNGKGPLADTSPFALYTRACDQGWVTGCEALAGSYVKGEGTARDPARAAELFDRACTGGVATACSNLGYMYYSADGVPEDRARGMRLLARSCEMGFANGCRWMKEIEQGARPSK
jgi:hypothetical protein